MDNGQLYTQAMLSTLRIVEQVPRGQWHVPTPCTEWDAEQVANHIIGENLWAGELFLGKTVAEVGARLDGDLTGDDPAAAYRRSVEVARKAVEARGAMNVTYLSFGDYSGADYAGPTVHGYIDSRLGYREGHRSGDPHRCTTHFGLPSHRRSTDAPIP